MRKMLCLILPVVFLASCTPQPPVEPTPEVVEYLDTNYSSFVLDYWQADRKIDIYSNTAWFVRVSGSWIEVLDNVSDDEREGSYVLPVRFYQNNTQTDREGIITIGYKVDGEQRNRRITILQKARPEQCLDTDYGYLKIAAGGEDCSVEVYSNAMWTAESSVDWIKVSDVRHSGSFTLPVKVLANTDPEERQGEITIVYNSGGEQRNKKVTVSQAGR